MPHTLAGRYEQRVSTGVIERDPAQAELVKRLSDLSNRLAEHRLARKSSALGWLFGKHETKAAPLKGLYIWGGVGRGKTLLMDLFFETVSVQRKRRAHFHSFMADVHERIFQHRQAVKAGTIKDGDPIRPVAEALAQEAWLLCFDEFAVTDIADAMILGRLFSVLFEKGVVVVATSNREPETLYQDGLNRALFLPFIAMINARMDVAELRSRTDYRLEKLAGEVIYHVPANLASRQALDAAFLRLTGGQPGTQGSVSVKDRTVPVSCQAQGVARFYFEDLCEKPLGARDYLALARAYHTLIVEDVPKLTFSRRNEAKRFITLIDILYENRVKLLMSAASEPQTLYVAERGHEAFEFDRTVSRLIEMRSQAYLALPHGAVGGEQQGDSGGLVET